MNCQFAEQAKFFDYFFSKKVMPRGEHDKNSFLGDAGETRVSFGFIPPGKQDKSAGFVETPEYLNEFYYYRNKIDGKWKYEIK